VRTIYSEVSEEYVASIFRVSVLIMKDNCVEDGGRTFLRNAVKNFISCGIRIQKIAVVVCLIFSYEDKLSCSFSFSSSSIQCSIIYFTLCPIYIDIYIYIYTHTG